MVSQQIKSLKEEESKLKAAKDRVKGSNNALKELQRAQGAAESTAASQRLREAEAQVRVYCVYCVYCMCVCVCVCVYVCMRVCVPCGVRAGVRLCTLSAFAFRQTKSIVGRGAPRKRCLCHRQD